ncbi:hypothetical protein CMQ_5581 [Grosmannia clavigera kw1407]|uniref:Helicase-like protein n=1 Tax=Grosmannia clavigera (strain kw1407 / UAMH 11150) TaxID=655863 RepID=F0XTB3_GROCL|nr:uncharacterized protein CMQ_5581 [Grosmannia clavigera kw1407]EFW99160.1 hypothetical protein CMQ_5581 [Grosmannia clavigera kw1407]
MLSLPKLKRPGRDVSPHSSERTRSQSDAIVTTGKAWEHGDGCTSTKAHCSKRELLHDLISRSVRGAGRALAPSQPQDPPDHQSSRHSHRRRHTSTAVTSRNAATAATSTASAAAAANHNADLHLHLQSDSLIPTASPLRPALSSITSLLLSTPSHPVVPVHADKPLPAPPLPGNIPDVRPPAKPVLKLTRIMANLTADDIETLFSGAPQFFARSEGHFTGAPHPSTAFPWDEALHIRDLADHIRIEDAAWSSVTAWPHVIRCKDHSPEKTSIDGLTREADDPPPIKKRGHYYPRCRERPSMLSMQGLEKGTIGYEAALELSVSDALQEEQFGFDTVGSRPAAIREARRNLMTPTAAKSETADQNASGVKFVGETQILEELIKNGRRYATGNFYSSRQGQEFYDELFGHILHPPKKARSFHVRSSSQSGSWGNGVTGHLVAQIEALLDVLATPNVWIDFSHVEWRLRLGQILWTSSAPDELDDGIVRPQEVTAAPQSNTYGERYTERYWLLLQILLSTELLLRLDAITDGDEIGLEYVRPAEVQRFEKEANQSVRWSLIIARAWLENMEVVRVGGPEEKVEKKAFESPEKERQGEPQTLFRSGTINVASLAKNKPKESGLKHTIGWITTLTRKLSLAEGHLHAPIEPHERRIYAMKAKYVRRQQHGIVHFARELRWPDERIEQTLRHRVEMKEQLNTKIAEFTATESEAVKSLASLMSTCSIPATSKTKLEFNRKLPRRRKVVAGLHPNGWLSKSYLSGLMLPGDGLCTLLMAALLESDEAAMKELGNIAHLGAGFVYHGKSFWSTASVVGRVLAAGAGAAECMGWVSSDVLPHGFGSGWINVNVDDVAEDSRLLHRRARIWGKAAIERGSYVLGDADPASVLPADFVIPFETTYKEQPPAHTQIELRRFELSDNSESAAEGQDHEIRPKETGNSTKAGSGTAKASIFKSAAAVSFGLSSDGGPEKAYTYTLLYDIYFVTAHPCVVSQRVKVLKSPSSPTIQQVDVTGSGFAGHASSSIPIGHLLHKYYTYASIHLTTLIENKDKTLAELLVAYVASTNRSARAEVAKVLVIDCMTGFSPQPTASEMPLSPVFAERPSIDSVFPLLTREISPITGLTALDSAADSAAQQTKAGAELPRKGSSESSRSSGSSAYAAKNEPTPPPSQMHHETRRRRFGSDMEIMVRAFCAEKGWNALVSRRRRGCLACAIREAGALGWKVVIRVD